ncbi:hypothetical protein [Halovenus sp. HT40]|uniref:hypothetical protein n=1 Tax=Halovenus sp. HT40 TaxID=3126691 RepID=UPI00300E94C4
MSEPAVDSELAVKLAGAAFLLLGAVFAGFGLWAEEFLITVAGGFTGAAGIVLLGLSPRLEG